MAKDIRRIAIVTGDHFAPDPTKRGNRYNEEDIVTHDAMVAAFRSLPGYSFTVFNRHDGMIEALEADPPDLVVNFCDTGFHNIPTQEIHLPCALELRGIPYTGAPPAAMVICYDKAIVRLVAESHGVAVPREAFIAADASLETLPDIYPALIKPNTADGSVGITKDAVVHHADEARKYLEWMRESLPGRDALMQEYLPGPEYGIGVIGNPEDGLTVLPPMAVDFSALPAGLAPILSYESKALPDSPYYTEIKFARADLSAETEERMAGWAKLLFHRLGLRDYGRFDFRAAADGTPRLMEVNPNPAWANDAKLAFMAGFAGMDYPAMLHQILKAAFARLARAES